MRVLVCSALEAAGFANGFSTRLGGVSPFPENDLNLAGFGEDTRENIAENRRRFLAAFDGPYQLATVWQVHGSDLRIVDGPADIGSDDIKADGVLSNVDGVLAGVKTADCVPVLLGDPVTKAYAAVHAGWRGTARRIAQRAAASMAERFGSDPSDIVAAIGPAAGAAKYEVGQDVIDAFGKVFDDTGKYFTPTRDGHALLDQHLANRDQLIDAGLKPENIHIAPFCTIERVDLFFSYRIEKKVHGRTGRLLSVIGQL